MEECNYAFLNLILTAGTAIIESSQAKNKQEIPVIVLKRIRENRTIEAIVKCKTQKKCVCG
ncbi:MAG: hypothetical protein KGI27_12810 [Thaumarchaeota archaeon]|nr:hypothetical protein [Nitrososphaerota archaeon]